jgi:hypothetical protein
MYIEYEVYTYIYTYIYMYLFFSLNFYYLSSLSESKTHKYTNIHIYKNINIHTYRHLQIHTKTITYMYITNSIQNRAHIHILFFVDKLIYVSLMHTYKYLLRTQIITYICIYIYIYYAPFFII